MSDDKRDMIANLLEGAGSLMVTVTSGVGDAGIATAGGAGRAILGLAAALVRSLGVNGAKKTLEELKKRVDAGEGVITEADLASDDAKVEARIAELFGSSVAPSGLTDEGYRLQRLLDSTPCPSCNSREALQVPTDRLQTITVCSKCQKSHPIASILPL